MAAATQELQEAEANPLDAEWISRNLPDGTYTDLGSVLSALSASLSLPADAPAALVSALSMRAIALESHLVVGPDQTAVLVGKNGQLLDRFGPGEHVISRETAPLATAQSRAPAPGFAKGVLSVTPVFASARETRAAVQRSSRARSGEPVAVRGTITFSITSLGDFLARSGPRPRGVSAGEVDAAVNVALGPSLDQTIAAHDAREFAAPSKLLEEAIRTSGAEAGLRITSVSLGSSGPMSMDERMAAIQERRRQAMAQMPPEMQARIQTQMAMATAQASAARAGKAGGAGGTGPTLASPVSGTATPGTTCPACQASNPPGVRFCGNCGKPLPIKRACPRCGADVAPGVKFCGNCGGPVA
ncbi:MAG: zinc ribbon domain-containing protein [Thermoplasmata archaeon]